MASSSSTTTNPPSPSRLIAFYQGHQPDTEGRMLQEILAWDDDELEARHDFIQWLFPLTTRSSANWSAPQLARADIQAFRGDPKLRAQLRVAFERMLRFYGFAYHRSDDRLVIERAAAWDERRRVWLTRGNHNFLRITRILTSLRTLGLPDDAAAFYAALQQLSSSLEGGVIGGSTLNY